MFFNHTTRGAAGRFSLGPGRSTFFRISHPQLRRGGFSQKLGPSPDLGSRLLSGKRPIAAPALSASAQTPAGVGGVSPHLPLGSLAGSPGFGAGRARRGLTCSLRRPAWRTLALPGGVGARDPGGPAQRSAGLRRPSSSPPRGARLPGGAGSARGAAAELRAGVGRSLGRSVGRAGRQGALGALRPEQPRRFPAPLRPARRCLCPRGLPGHGRGGGAQVHQAAEQAGHGGRAAAQRLRGGARLPGAGEAGPGGEETRRSGRARRRPRPREDGAREGGSALPDALPAEEGAAAPGRGGGSAADAPRPPHGRCGWESSKKTTTQLSRPLRWKLSPPAPPAAFPGSLLPRSASAPPGPSPDPSSWSPAGAVGGPEHPGAKGMQEDTPLPRALPGSCCDLQQPGLVVGGRWSLSLSPHAPANPSAPPPPFAPTCSIWCCFGALPAFLSKGEKGTWEAGRPERCSGEGEDAAGASKDAWPPPCPPLGHHLSPGRASAPH